MNFSEKIIVFERKKSKKTRNPLFDKKRMLVNMHAFFLYISRDRAAVARRAHNPKVGGSNPPPATTKKHEWRNW